MKKFIFILLTILLIILMGLCLSYQKDITSKNPIRLLDGSLEYDFMKPGDKKASQELYDFVINDINNNMLKELNMTAKQIADYTNITPEMVNAFYVDLNDDGVEEIIGLVHSTYYMCAEGYKLFILEKNNLKYSDLTIINFFPLKNLIIRNNKFNNYKEMEASAISSDKWLKGKTVIWKIYIKYYNKKYRYDGDKIDKKNHIRLKKEIKDPDAEVLNRVLGI